ncbi:MAG: hypothetical protein QXS23_05255 [Desulfurococcaceae archaeon]
MRPGGNLAWALITFLIMYTMTLAVSNAFYVFIAALRLVLPWIPETFDLSKWLSYLRFSLWFLFIVSGVLMILSLVYYKRRREAKDYIEEVVRKL